MNSEESGRANDAQDVITVQPPVGIATVLLQHSNELSVRQTRSEQRADQDSRWRSHYEDTGSLEDYSSEILIANEYELLKDAWRAFSEASKDKQSQFYTNKADLLEWRENITIDDLRDSVQSAAEKLDERHGKTRRNFDRFCSSLSSHSAILEVLPNQSQYLSIFCGTVKTLLKASDNYRKTAEGLSKALAEIGDCVHLSVQQAKLVNTSSMRDAVRQLYVSVFVFLRESMLWYKATRLQRLSKSFDQNFYDKFSDLLDNVKQRAEKIHIRGNVGHHAKTTDIIHLTRNMNEKLDRVLTTQDEDRRKWQKLQAPQATFYVASYNGDPKAREACVGIGDSSIIQIQGVLASPGSRTISVPEIPNGRPYLGQCRSRSRLLLDELQAASQGLDAHILGCIDPNEVMRSETIYFENSVVFAIRDWNVAPSSMLLRISGNSEIKYPSATSAISAVAVGSASGLPLIHLFCGWSAKERKTLIISALYSLIRQLAGKIEDLNKEFLSSIIARIQELDGTIETWDKALLLFSSLLLNAPPELIVIIDGIERLEDEGSHQEYISSLINVLSNQAYDYNICGTVGKRLKVLFTTAGPCAGLNSIDEKFLKTIAMKRQSTKRRPGEARLGRSQITLSNQNEQG